MARIGIDARLLGYTRGGIARYIVELARALPKVAPDLDVQLLISRKARSAFADGGWPLFTPPHHRVERWTLPVELASRRLDVCHFPDHVTPHRLGFRSVVTVHDLAFQFFPDTHTAESRRYYGELTRSLRRVQAVIAVSEHTRHDVLTLTGVSPDRVTTVHNGISGMFRPSKPGEADAGNRALLERFALPEGYVLTVGTLSPRKNLSTLLDALTIARGQGCDLELAVVGEQGWLFEPALARIRELGLGRVVHLLGAVDDADLLALYRGARLFAFPSLYEGFALPPLEAMACGVPVVASSAGSIPEVLGDAAVLIGATDVNGLANAILSMDADVALRSRLRQRGLAQAARFTWERCARETAAVYARVLAER
jgi:glycosyltransferase involved in cell wall biosynthesis